MTDTWTMVGIAKDIHRFQPSVASLRDLEMIHGNFEHMALDEARALSHGLRSASGQGTGLNGMALWLSVNRMFSPRAR